MKLEMNISGKLTTVIERRRYRGIFPSRETMLSIPSRSVLHSALTLFLDLFKPLFLIGREERINPIVSFIHYTSHCRPHRISISTVRSKGLLHLFLRFFIYLC